MSISRKRLFDDVIVHNDRYIDCVVLSRSLFALLLIIFSFSNGLFPQGILINFDDFHWSFDIKLTLQLLLLQMIYFERITKIDSNFTTSHS